MVEINEINFFLFVYNFFFFNFILLSCGDQNFSCLVWKRLYVLGWKPMLNGSWHTRRFLELQVY